MPNRTDVSLGNAIHCVGGTVDKVLKGIVNDGSSRPVETRCHFYAPKQFEQMVLNLSSSHKSFTS